MRTVCKILPVIFVVSILLMQASQNGYSASGFYFTDSTTITVSDSTPSLIDSVLVAKENLAEGKTLYEKKCQRCHELHSPKDYRLNVWKENLEEMKDKAGLTKGEYRLILGYLAANCKK